MKTCHSKTYHSSRLHRIQGEISEKSSDGFRVNPCPLSPNWTPSWMWATCLVKKSPCENSIVIAAWFPAIGWVCMGMSVLIFAFIYLSMYLFIDLFIYFTYILNYIHAMYVWYIYIHVYPIECWNMGRASKKPSTIAGVWPRKTASRNNRCTWPSGFVSAGSAQLSTIVVMNC